MSETPSENGQLDTVDEPSMEDILASIRKIISDDDQGMEQVEAEPSSSSGGLNSKGYVSEALVTGSFGHAPSAPEPEPVSESYDANSVFNDLRGSNGLDDILQNDFDSDDDLVDLDIEALLSQADAPLETLDDSLDENTSEEESLMDILAMDIPEPEAELSIKPSESYAPDKALSVGGSQPFDEDVETIESLDVFEEDSDSDSLFDELESLLTDEVGAGDKNDLQHFDSSAVEDVPEPIVERKERRGLFGAGLAAVGFGAKARQKSTEKTEVEKGESSIDTSSTASADDELDAMLETLINDIEPAAEDVTETKESFSVPEIETSDVASTLSGNMPSLQTDAEEMDLVKSLMADLSDPDSQASEDQNLDIEMSLDDSLRDVSAASAVVMVDVLDEDSPSSDDFDDAQDIQTLTDENLDLDIEALLNGGMDETQVDDFITGSTPKSLEVNAEDDNETNNILDDILDMSLEDELETHEDELESLLEIPELSETPQESVEVEETHSPESDTLLDDDIFALSEDDLVPDMDAVLQDEAENIALNNVEAATEINAPTDMPKTSSLLEIAMEAEKEAEILEAKPERVSEPVTELMSEPVVDSILDPLVQDPEEAPSVSDSKISGGTIAAASGLGLAAIAAASSGILQTVETKSSEEEVEVSEAQPTSTPAPETHNIAPEPEQIIQKETAPMPSAAAKSETILDEVTEASTAEVFASLNQVVEEKAIVAERGDRVGDLVMEALRPMLKEWLDENLKGIVERAVTKEVKRISSGK